MMDEIFELIMKEATSRKDQAFEVAILEVLFELITRIFDAFKPLQVQDIKSTRLKFRRKES